MKERRYGYNFAVIFKSSDPEALLKVTRYINERVADSRIVFSTGPTDRFLWVLQQKERGVQGNGREL